MSRRQKQRIAMARVDPSLQTQLRQPIIPNLDFEYSDSGIHKELHLHVKYSSGEVYPRAEQLDEVMTKGTAFLEPVLGIPSRLWGAEDTEDGVKAKDHAVKTQKYFSKCEPGTVGGLVASPELPNKASGVDILKPEREGIHHRSLENGCAWRPDDAFRPQSLPNLLKQNSFSMNSERHCGSGAVTQASCHNVISQPSSCPVCYEDLDCTDSSFCPCSCGFRLCLFCHKRILEADGRCPGCRKQYDTINGEKNGNGGTLPF
ncbi:hypothetical protein HHK36_029689 [Tetracentron sinense]|uniref:RING-type domain-containing protein n=1 Tax=Tetracentron sinense TaxID=13715 RepID=A0A834YDD9_TETSI|nr:hypothetical protein HHK36_029689 [Tetracentron sinense]